MAIHHLFLVLAISRWAERASENRRTGTIRSLSELEGLYPARPAPPRGRLGRNTTLFIGIASYRDNRCGRTLERAFAEAWDPHRVFIGVVQQNEPGDSDCVADFCALQRQNRARGSPYDRPGDVEADGAGADRCDFRDQIRVRNMPASEARGPAHARHFQQQLIANESFCLQVDAHSDFRRGWDRALLREWGKCRNEYAVLTTYPPRMSDKPLDGFESWRAVEDGYPDASSVAHLCEATVTNAGHFRNEQAAMLMSPGDEPVLTSKWAAGLSFSKCHAERRVPNDRHLPWIWDGEEMSRAARLWTHGYDFYTPSKSIVFHDYGRQGTVVGAPIPADIQRASNERIFTLLGMRGAGRQNVSWGRYGLGSTRTLEQFGKFSGLDFQASRVDNSGQCADLLFVPWLPHIANDLGAALAEQAAADGAASGDERWERALVFMDMALKQQPANATLLHNRGLLNRLLWRVADAIRDLRLALALQPDLEAARLSLVAALAQRSLGGASGAMEAAAEACQELRRAGNFKSLNSSSSGNNSVTVQLLLNALDGCEPEPDAPPNPKIRIKM